MGSRYAVEGSVAVAGDTTLSVIASTTARPKIYYVSFCSESAPADSRIVAVVKRFTADGTGTGVTPEPLEVGDRAAVSTSKQTYTAEPTYTGIPILTPTIHQRSHYQWYAHEGGELIAPAAAGNGFGLQITTFTSGTPDMSTVFHFQE